MKLHPREEIVRKAESAFFKFLLENEAWKQLTGIEESQILLSVIQTFLKHELRAERHPDEPDRPAGLL